MKVKVQKHKLQDLNLNASLFEANGLSVNESERHMY